MQLAPESARPPLLTPERARTSLSVHSVQLTLLRFMKTPFFFRSLLTLIAISLLSPTPAGADTASDSGPLTLPGAAPAPALSNSDFLRSRSEGVQVTQMGNMRASFVFTHGLAEGLKAQVTELFSDVGFRVFSSAAAVDETTFSPTDYHAMGKDRYADLVVLTKAAQIDKKLPSGQALIVKSTVTCTVYNPQSGETLVGSTQEATSHRLSDVCELAAKDVITKILEKARSMIVHEAQIKGVQDHQHLLEIMNHTSHLEGVHHVRQCSYNKDTKLAIIEIIGAPQTEVFWPAWVDKMPRREKIIRGDGAIKIVPAQSTPKPKPKTQPTPKRG
jgi:hypothetical protein